MSKPIPAEALDLYVRSEDCTLREYLKLQLTTLWRESEGFSGKRPLGDSGWEWEIAQLLVEAGYVEGKLETYDDDGEDYTELVEFPKTFTRKMIEFIENHVFA